MTSTREAHQGEQTNLNGLDLATGRSFPRLGKEDASYEEGASLIASALVNNQYGRLYVLAEVGDQNHGHSHTFDHSTWVVTGGVRVIAADIDVTVEAPFVLNVPAGVEHQFVATHPNTTYICTHIVNGDTRNGDNPGRLIGGLTGPGLAQQAKPIRV